MDGSITLLDNNPVYSSSDDVIIETTTEIDLSATVNIESGKTAKKKEKAKNSKELKSDKTEKKEKKAEKTDKAQDKTKKMTKKEKGEKVKLVESTHVVEVKKRVVEFNYNSVKKVVGVYDYFSSIRIKH